MKKKVLLVFVFAICQAFYGQVKLDNWFKIESKKFHGYFNYLVAESSSSIHTTVNSRYRVGNQNIVLSDFLHIVSQKDPLLPVTYFVIEGTSDDLSENPRKVSRHGMVSSLNDRQTWKVNWTDSETITKRHTIALWNIPHILTTLEYSKKGKLLDFNLMETHELDYEEGNYLEYVSDETISINNKETSVRKIVLHLKNGQISYWLDFENNVIQVRIDKTNFIRCEKKDVPFEEFNWEFN